MQRRRRCTKTPGDAVRSTAAYDGSGNALPQNQALTLDTRLYDGAGRLIQSGPTPSGQSGSLDPAYVAALQQGGNSDANGAIRRDNNYDADGRLLTRTGRCRAT